MISFSNITTKLKPYLNHAIFIFCVLVSSYTTFRIIVGTHRILQLSFLFIFLTIYVLSAYKLSFYVVLIPFGIMLSFFEPINEMFGAIDSGVLIAILNTNTTEALDFLTLLPLQSLKFPILLLLSYCCLYFLAKRASVKPLNNHKFMLLVTSVAFSMFAYNYVGSNLYKMNEAFNKAKEADIKNSSVIIDDFQNSNLSFTPKYDNYIIIMDESIDRRYMQTYGYQIANNPYLSSTNAIVVDGFVGSYFSTIPSIRLMLTNTQSYEKPINYNQGLLNLMHDVGMELFWLSNQAANGALTGLAINGGVELANIHFPKLVYQTDMNLIEPFKEVLEKYSNQPKFIILHLDGSHPNPCVHTDNERNFISKDSKFEQVSCYMQTMQETDAFIQKITSILQDKAQSYKIIYTADHAVSLFLDKGLFTDSYKFRHENYIGNTQTPLILLASDLTERKYIKSRKLAIKFTEGVASAFGISSSILKKYDMFDGIDDTDTSVTSFIEAYKTTGGHKDVIDFSKEIISK